MDLLKLRNGEQAKGKVTGPKEEKIAFEDLERAVNTEYQMGRLKSIRRVHGAFKHLRGTFGGEPVLSITDQRVKRYVVDRQESGAADSTIQKELAAVRRGFNLLNQSHTTKIPNLNPDNVRTGFFGPGDLERLVKELPDALKPLVRFAFLTGWRKGEILPLPWLQVDFTAGILRLDPGSTKNKEGRVFPFRALPPLADLLDAQREHTRKLERDEGRIISHVLHRDGEPIRSMIGAWRSACKRAGEDRHGACRAQDPFRVRTLQHRE